MPYQLTTVSLRLIQLLDLDIGWGHRLFGFDDQSDLIAGAKFVGWLVSLGMGWCFFLGMELLGPLAVGFRNVDAFCFFGGKENKGVFEEMGMVSNIVCCECWMPKTVTLDDFEADSCVGIFYSFVIFQRCIFCHANVYIYK